MVCVLYVHRQFTNAFVTFIVRGVACLFNFRSNAYQLINGLMYYTQASETGKKTHTYTNRHTQTHKHYVYESCSLHVTTLLVHQFEHMLPLTQTT